MFPEAFSAEFGSGGKVPGVGEGQSAFFLPWELELTVRLPEGMMPVLYHSS